jgi:hypothetical protein
MRRFITQNNATPAAAPTQQHSGSNGRDVFAMVDVLDVLKSLSDPEKDTNEDAAAARPIIRVCTDCPLLATHSREVVVSSSRIRQEGGADTEECALIARGITSNGCAVATMLDAKGVLRVYACDTTEQPDALAWKLCVSFADIVVQHAAVDCNDNKALLIYRAKQRSDADKSCLILIDMKTGAYEIKSLPLSLAQARSVRYASPNVFAVLSNTQLYVDGGDFAPESVRYIACEKQRPIDTLHVGRWVQDNSDARTLCNVMIGTPANATATAMPFLVSIRVDESTTPRELRTHCAGEISQLANNSDAEAARFIRDQFAYHTPIAERANKMYIDHGVVARWSEHNAWLWDMDSNSARSIRDHANLWAMCAGARSTMALYRKQGDIMLLDRRDGMCFARSIPPVPRLPLPLYRGASEAATRTLMDDDSCGMCTYTKSLDPQVTPAVYMSADERTLVVLDEASNVRVIYA